MDEFVSGNREQAERMLRALFQQEATPGIDPLLEIIGMLLADEPGRECLTADSSLTTQQWLTWNELALTQPNETRLMVKKDLERAGMGPS